MRLGGGRFFFFSAAWRRRPCFFGWLSPVVCFFLFFRGPIVSRFVPLLLFYMGAVCFPVFVFLLFL